MKTAANTSTNPSPAADQKIADSYQNLYVETYGCQMNEYDSGLVKALLKNQSGLKTVAQPDMADVILLNTCAIRENAHAKIYARLRHLESLKKKNDQLVFGLLGCMAQNLAEDIWAQNLPLDFIAGPDAYRKLPEMLTDIRTQRHKNEKLAALNFDINENYGDILPVHNPDSSSFFVTIMRGCNNFCTFCVVPRTRGRERSLAVKDIIAEINHFVTEYGKQEVTLLGQNVNSYRYEGQDFTDLVKAVLSDTDVKRIRFTSPHPKDFPDKLIDLMAENPRFCPSIHLPLQAGNAKVLKEMKRNYTGQEFVNLALDMYKRIPGLAISTDIIVGFPNETESEFLETLDVYEKVRFDAAFMFKYSQRKDTLASEKFADNVPEDQKQSRLERLVATQNRISSEKNRAHVGEVLEVLVESTSKRNPLEWKGRAANNKIVIYTHEDEQVGDFVPVLIESSSSATLKGKIKR